VTRHRNFYHGMKKHFAAVCAVLICCGCTLAVDKEFVVEPATVLSTLDANHPRLLLKDKDMERLKEQYTKDEVLQKCLRDVLKKADGYVQKPVISYDKNSDGPFMQPVSRECLRRIYALGLAWRWTGDEKYAKKAKEDLLAVSAFKDWNPPHFLDVAEMSHAVGIGYDWFFHYFDEQRREQIKSGLIKNAMKVGVAAYTGRGIRHGEDGRASDWWAKSWCNWNQVCNSGLMIGALAIAETEPEYARSIVVSAVASLPNALRMYGPDGAWPEGPGYWAVATRYTAYGLSALDTALGREFGLSKITGMSEAALFPIYTAGPTGLFLNFADSAEESLRRPMPWLFWLARTYNNPLFAEAEHTVLADYDASAEHIIWYRASSGAKPYPKSLDRYFRGPVEVAVFRSAWNDPEALFVGVKAGYNQVSHGHLDLGQFWVDALGVRWVRDLGSEDYLLPGYWRKGKAGKRWSYYRLSSFSHNVPVLGGENQDVFAKTKFIRFSSEKSSAMVLVDVTNAYKKFASKVIRGIAIVENRRAVLVQDEFEIKKRCELAWGMTTDAEITIRGKNAALLTLNGKALVAQILCPGDAEFVVESAEQKPPLAPNTGVKRLMVRLQGAKGSVRIAIVLSPVWKDEKVVKAVEIKPLSQW